MKKILMLALGAAFSLAAPAATLRVNNTIGSGAQYTTFADAHEAAQDGDVIIVDGSPKSYGKIEVLKKITVQGPGYFLGVNNVAQEGHSPASFEEVKLRCDGAKIVGLCIEGYLYMRANSLVVTRCYIRNIQLGVNFGDNNITRGVIHQNYLVAGIMVDSYSVPATLMQVTNNIINGGGNSVFCGMENSVISRNSVITGEPGVRNLTNCVIENNISYNIESDYYNNSNNYYSNNYDYQSIGVNKFYNSPKNDYEVKVNDAALSMDIGAFSGEDPYVLSGLTTGPIIQDVSVPESVIRGEDLKVTVKIGASR